MSFRPAIPRQEDGPLGRPPGGLRLHPPRRRPLLLRPGLLGLLPRGAVPQRSRRRHRHVRPAARLRALVPRQGEDIRHGRRAGTKTVRQFGAFASFFSSSGRKE